MRLLKKISKYPKKDICELKERLNLSDDESEVFDLIMRKKSITEISIALNLSDRTIYRRINEIENLVAFIEYVDTLAINTNKI